MDERRLLEEYVAGGGLMQLATVGDDCTPRACSVWYLPSFGPDRLYFISRRDRVHSKNIDGNSAVAGAIIVDPPAELGLTGRGVSFTGTARQLPGTGNDAVAAAFAARWPRASGVLSAMPDAASRLYEIAVAEWVLYDEENFPASPRRTVSAG